MTFEFTENRAADPEPRPFDLEAVNLYQPRTVSDGRAVGRNQTSTAVMDRSTVQEVSNSNAALNNFERRRYAPQFETAYEGAIAANFNYRSENLAAATQEAAKTGKPLVMVFSDIRNTSLTPQDGLVGKMKSLVGGEGVANEKAIYVFCDLDSVREKVARGEDPPEARLLREAGISNRPLRPEDGLFHPSLMVFGVKENGQPTQMDVFQDVRHDPRELKNSIERVAARDDAERRRQINVPPPPGESSEIAPPIPPELQTPPPPSAGGSDNTPPLPTEARPNAGDVLPPLPQPSGTDLPPPPPVPAEMPPEATVPTNPNAADLMPPVPQVTGTDQSTSPPVPSEAPPAERPPGAVEPTGAVRTGSELNPKDSEMQSILDRRHRVEEELRKIDSYKQASEMFYGSSSGSEKSLLAIKRELSDAMKKFEASVNSPQENEEDDFEKTNALLQNAAKLFQEEQTRARAIETVLQGVDFKEADHLRMQAQKQREDEFQKWRDNRAVVEFVNRYREKLDIDDNEICRPGDEEWRTP